MSENGPDLLASFNFYVEVDGLTLAAFQEVSGISTEHEVITHDIVNDQGQQVSRKIQGRRLNGELTLKRGIAADTKDWWDWLNDVTNGKLERKNGSIVVLDHDKNEKLRYNFVGAWPSKVTVNGLLSTGSDVPVEEIVLQHEGLEFPGTTG